MYGGVRFWALGLCAAAIAVGAAGCGGDEEESKAQGQEFALANEPAGVFMRRTAKLLATTKARKDCQELDAVNAQSTLRFSCPPDKKLRASMKDFEIVGAATYGTGAVIDYKSGEVGGGATIVLFVAPNRNWGIARFGVLTEPSTDTSDDETREKYDETVEAYFAAIRDRDCAAFMKVAFISSEIEKGFCKKRFPGTKALAKRLRANPSDEPVYQGGNGTYGFYKFETAKPTPSNVTISVVKGEAEGSERYAVLSMAPSPTAAEQRRVIRQFRRQQREARTATGMESSPGSTNRLPPADGSE